MSHETFTPEEFEKILKSQEITKLFKKENVATTLSSVVKTVPEKARGILSHLTEFTLVFFYFLFTGLAILFRSPLPKEWLRLLKRLDNSKIDKVVEDIKDKTLSKIHKKYKVVDLDTAKTVKLPTTS